MGAADPGTECTEHGGYRREEVSFADGGRMMQRSKEEMSNSRLGIGEFRYSDADWVTRDQLKAFF